LTEPLPHTGRQPESVVIRHAAPHRNVPRCGTEAARHDGVSASDML